MNVSSLVSGIVALSITLAGLGLLKPAHDYMRRLAIEVVFKNRQYKMSDFTRQLTNPQPIRKSHK